MKSKRYPEEFKIEAVKQLTERGYSVAEVAQRFDTTTHNLYAWIKKYGEQPQFGDLDLTSGNARIRQNNTIWFTFQTRFKINEHFYAARHLN